MSMVPREVLEEILAQQGARPPIPNNLPQADIPIMQRLGNLIKSVQPAQALDRAISLARVPGQMAAGKVMDVASNLYQQAKSVPQDLQTMGMQGMKDMGMLPKPERRPPGFYSGGGTPQGQAVAVEASGIVDELSQQGMKPQQWSVRPLETMQDLRDAKSTKELVEATIAMGTPAPRSQMMVKGKLYDFPAQRITTTDDAMGWLKSKKIPLKGRNPGAAMDDIANVDDFWKMSTADRARVYAQVQRGVTGKPYRGEKLIKPNSKTAWKTGDTSRGCSNMCLSCYGNKLARKSGIQHAREVPAKLKGSLRRGEVLRIGETGDPAASWAHSAKEVQGVLARSSKAGATADDVFTISKLQNIDDFDPKTFRNLQVSLDPMNPEHMKRSMENIMKLRKADPSLNIAVRVRSIDSANPELMAMQDQAVDFANKMDLPVLETRMRFQSKKVMGALELNPNSYQRVGNQFKGRPVLQGKAKKYLLCDRMGVGCAGCNNCMKLLRPEQRAAKLAKDFGVGEGLSPEARKVAKQLSAQERDALFKGFGLRSPEVQPKIPSDKVTLNEIRPKLTDKVRKVIDKLTAQEKGMLEPLLNERGQLGQGQSVTEALSDWWKVRGFNKAMGKASPGKQQDVKNAAEILQEILSTDKMTQIKGNIRMEAMLEDLAQARRAAIADRLRLDPKAAQKLLKHQTKSLREAARRRATYDRRKLSRWTTPRNRLKPRTGFQGSNEKTMW